jgi:hypothetical protein
MQVTALLFALAVASAAASIHGHHDTPALDGEWDCIFDTPTRGQTFKAGDVVHISWHDGGGAGCPMGGDASIGLHQHNTLCGEWSTCKTLYTSMGSMYYADYTTLSDDIKPGHGNDGFYFQILPVDGSLPFNSAPFSYSGHEPALTGSGDQS